MEEEVQQENISRPDHVESRSHTGIFAIIFLALAGLAGTQIYSISQIRSMRDSQAAFQSASRAETDQKVAMKVAAVENASAQALEAMKAELDSAAVRMGSTGSQLQRARTMLTKLQKQEQDEAAELKQEIAAKADAQQVGSLTEDVSATKTDLDNTKKAVDATRSDLGMTRSEFGTLIARNHDDLEQLRKMGERDYFEFTLPRNKQENVAGVGLILKKVNLKRHRFTMNLLADDMVIEKKDRTVNEPVFFAVGSSKKFYELVINQVDSNQVKGYISTPKGVTETAAVRTGG